jgi:hypothetical protein
MTTPTIGAIRWDPWYSIDPASPGKGEAILLGDSDLQSRAPVHWTSANSYTLNRVAGTQAIIDAEITAAAANGVAYWAYLRYDDTPGQAHYSKDMNVAWTFHQSSSIANTMPWASMMQTGSMGSTGSYTTQNAQLVSWFQQANYFTVLAGRPLLYIYWEAADLTTYWGDSLANFAAMITALRAACTAASVANPYIVAMNNLDVAVKTGIGADAICSYTPQVVLTPNMTYAAFDTGVQAYWAKQLATGSKFVLNASSGYVSIGRYRRPETYIVATARPRIGGLGTVTRPTAAELKAHIAAARAYVLANTAVCDANTVLLYAWSEHMEGNAIAPSIANPSGLALV